MNGFNLRRRTAELLNENQDTSAFMNKRTTYDYCYDAAKDWILETECCTTEQDITTVATTAAYMLNGDYLGLYFIYELRYYIKLNIGGSHVNDIFVEFRDWNEVYYDNDITPTPQANYFTLKDYGTMLAQVAATASANGANVAGKSLLTSATAVFANVSPGDPIIDTTSAATGIVISVVDTKNIYVALFDATNAYVSVAQNDAFIIQPKARMEVILDPPPSVSGYTYILPYLQLPSPVYSDYDVYQIPFDYTEGFANYAAWKYKERDKEFDYGKQFLAAYARELAKYKKVTEKAFATKPARLVPRLKR